MLMNVRKYSVAADLLQAGAAGENAAATIGLASSLRKACFHEQMQFSNTPRDSVRAFLLATLDTNLTPEKLSAFVSRNAMNTIKTSSQEDLRTISNAGRSLRRSLARKGIPPQPAPTILR